MQRRSIGPVKICIGAALLGTIFCCRPQTSSEQRIVMITLDTLRYDALFGGPGHVSDMPETLGLAQRGTRFERAFSATSTTLPTHVSLFTGLHPWEHGVTANGTGVPEGLQTLAERLRTAGFSTNAVVASLPVRRHSRIAQGFDVFLQHPDDEETVQHWRDWNQPRPHYGLAPAIVHLARRVLARARGPRQFFWFHFWDGHAPYGDAANAATEVRDLEVVLRARSGEETAPLLAQARLLYEKDVKSLDRALAPLLRDLIGDATNHVVLTADHGEAFGEHGLFGHGTGLSDVQIHVPLVIWSDFLEVGARRDVTGSVDVFATVLDLTGEPVVGHGRSLLRTRTGEAWGMRRTFEETRELFATDGRTYRVDSPLFYRIDSQGRTCRGNAQEAFGQLWPLAEVASQPCQKRFAQWEARVRSAPAPPVAPQIHEQLRALGYAQ